MRGKRIVCLAALTFVLALAFATKNGSLAQQTGAAAATPVGIFESHGDVGAVLHPGSVEYDAANRSYTISGSGENMWLGKDAFQFAWKKMSGDVTLTADISFLGKGGNEHRKAVLMIRQSLDADSRYADAALHGNGLTSLQYREEEGAATHEIQANVSAPKRVRIEKRGANFSLWLADASGEFRPAGGSTRIALKEPFYVGIGVCSHDKNVVERAVFSNVDLKTVDSAAAIPSKLYSALEIITVERFEAPNWMPDGKNFLTYDASAKGHPENKDVMLRMMTPKDKKITVLAKLFGGQGTMNVPSWSPDGKQLAFVSYQLVPSGNTVK